VKKLILRATPAAAAMLVTAAGLAFAGVAHASSLPTLRLTLTASSMTVGGATQSGAVNILTTATALKEGSAVLFELKPGDTVAELEAALEHGADREPNIADRYGSIVFDTEVNAGQTGEAQTLLVPGQYVALGGAHESSLKLKAPFTVTGATSPAVLPTPQATVGSIDFGFNGPTTLHDGELVRFDNEGFLVHMDIAFPAKSRSAANTIDEDLLSGREKGLEKLVVGQPITFAGPLSPEAFQQETITAKPGWYVQACFMETETGVDHTRLGMERILHIVK